MAREEKQLELLLDTVLNRLNDLKKAVGSMLRKLETEFETINWPTFLDNFALISSHVSTVPVIYYTPRPLTSSFQLTGLSKIISNEMAAPLRNLTVLPLMLSPEPDEALMQLTEGRIATFSHDMVPDYLRTKPEPTAEGKIIAQEAKGNSYTMEAAAKQVAQFTKVVSNIHDMISKVREEWDSDASTRAGLQQTSSLADTHLLVAAVGLGKNLKIDHMPMGGPMLAPRPTAPIAGVSPGQGTVGPFKSQIKTNIKAANQIHPYQR